MGGLLSEGDEDILATLIGQWRGHGIVSLPSVRPRAYDEEVRFARRSDRSLDYWQRAADAQTGEMLHSESGIWRVADLGDVEISIALPGATEVSEGSVAGRRLELTSSAIGRAITGARLVGTERLYELRAEEVHYEIAIATETSPIFGHILGGWRRADDRDQGR